MLDVFVKFAVFRIAADLLDYFFRVRIFVYRYVAGIVDVCRAFGISNYRCSYRRIQRRIVYYVQSCRSRLYLGSAVQSAYRRCFSSDYRHSVFIARKLIRLAVDIYRNRIRSACFYRYRRILRRRYRVVVSYSSYRAYSDSRRTYRRVRVARVDFCSVYRYFVFSTRQRARKVANIFDIAVAVRHERYSVRIAFYRKRAVREGICSRFCRR